jgi:hypothetical protein
MKLESDDPRLLTMCDKRGYGQFEPYFLDGWRYYSNGRIFVRIPAPGAENTNRLGLEEEHPRYFPSKARWKVADFAPWPAPNYVYKRIPCYWCEHGISGEDLMTCPTCGSDGEVVLPVFQIVCDRRIRPIHHAWVAALPNPEFLAEGGDCDWLAFRFGAEGTISGQGIIKPIYRDDAARTDPESIIAGGGVV